MGSVSGIYHGGVTVSDMQASLRFYRDGLGLEIEFDKIDFQQGMDITFVTTALNDEQGYALLHELGMPFLDQHDDKN